MNKVNGKTKRKGPGTAAALWLDAMDKVVESQATERGHLNQL